MCMGQNKQGVFRFLAKNAQSAEYITITVFTDSLISTKCHKALWVLGTVFFTGVFRVLKDKEINLVETYKDI